MDFFPLITQAKKALGIAREDPDIAKAMITIVNANRDIEQNYFSQLTEQVCIARLAFYQKLESLWTNKVAELVRNKASGVDEYISEGVLESWIEQRHGFGGGNKPSFIMTGANKPDSPCYDDMMMILKSCSQGHFVMSQWESDGNFHLVLQHARADASKVIYESLLGQLRSTVDSVIDTLRREPEIASIKKIDARLGIWKVTLAPNKDDNHLTFANEFNLIAGFATMGSILYPICYSSKYRSSSSSSSSSGSSESIPASFGTIACFTLFNGLFRRGLTTLNGSNAPHMFPSPDEGNWKGLFSIAAALRRLLQVYGPPPSPNPDERTIHDPLDILYAGLAIRCYNKSKRYPPFENEDFTTMFLWLFRFLVGVINRTMHPDETASIITSNGQLPNPTVLWSDQYRKTVLDWTIMFIGHLNDLQARHKFAAFMAFTAQHCNPLPLNAFEDPDYSDIRSGSGSGGAPAPAPAPVPVRSPPPIPAAEPIALTKSSLPAISCSLLPLPSASKAADKAEAPVEPMDDTDEEKADEDEDEDEGLCKICLENKSDTIFIPCGHLGACFDCASSKPGVCYFCNVAAAYHKVFNV